MTTQDMKQVKQSAQDAELIDAMQAGMTPLTPEQQAVADFWDGVDKASEEYIGEGGVVCKVKIAFAYKVFAGGYGGERQRETVFIPTRANGAADTPECKVARGQALQFIKSLGAAGAKLSPTYGVVILAEKAGAINVAKHEAVNWKSDQVWFIEIYKAGVRECLSPALRKFGMTLAKPWEGWVKIGWVNDPHLYKDKNTGELGFKMELDQNNNPRRAQIEIPTEMYESQADAYAQNSLDGSEVGAQVVLPAGYDDAVKARNISPSDWAALIPEFKAAANVAQAVADFELGGLEAQVALARGA